MCGCFPVSYLTLDLFSLPVRHVKVCQLIARHFSEKPHLMAMAEMDKVRDASH